MHKYEAFSFLDSIYLKVGPSEFGKICQILLGFTFIGCGYSVPRNQLSGRPDIVANKGKDSLSVEVKTSNSNEIYLKKDDLQGVLDTPSSEAIIAALSYPDIDIRWILADARKLNAKGYRKSELELFSIVPLETEINPRFIAELEKRKDQVKQGASILLEIFKEERNKGLHNGNY